MGGAADGKPHQPSALELLLSPPPCRRPGFQPEEGAHPASIWFIRILQMKEGGEAPGNAGLGLRGLPVSRVVFDICVSSCFDLRDVHAEMF